MNPLLFLEKRMHNHAQLPAMVWHDHTFCYADLTAKTEDWRHWLRQHTIEPGSVVVLVGDYSPCTVSLMIALFHHRCILVLMTPLMLSQVDDCIAMCTAEIVMTVDEDDRISCQRIRSWQVQSSNHYWSILRQQSEAGLVFFSSGSTGKSKAVVHQVSSLLKPLCVPSKPICTMGFLLFDHIGGWNTLFRTLMRGGCLVVMQARTPQAVSEAIRRHHVEALITTPSFLRLLLLSEDEFLASLKQLKYINYGTEPMPVDLLSQLVTLWPEVRWSQAYGMSEVGVLPIRSTSSASTWFCLDKERCPYRIIDGMLEVQAPTSMMGYLNAENPMTEDGWLPTGDMVETNGDCIRILGRRSEMINVGGQKVYPAEIEQVIGNMPEVLQVAVGSESHALLGQIVVANVRLHHPMPKKTFQLQLTQFCRRYLPEYKIPRKITVTDQILHNARFKMMRPKDRV